jgi:hypothetical protein
MLIDALEQFRAQTRLLGDEVDDLAVIYRPLESLADLTGYFDAACAGLAADGHCRELTKPWADLLRRLGRRRTPMTAEELHAVINHRARAWHGLVLWLRPVFIIPPAVATAYKPGYRAA